MTDAIGAFARYAGSPADEAVGADGGLTPPYTGIGDVLAQLGAAGLAAAGAAIEREREARGVVFGTFVDGEMLESCFPLCPVPRVVTAEDWAHVSAGVAQRTRALNAFLADVYRRGGRRRSDTERQSDIVRAGVLPEWVVADSPGWRPAAVGLAAEGQQRVTVAGMDLLRGPGGRWVALEDNLRVPSGIGFALANRDSGRAALPELHAGRQTTIADPLEAVGELRAALGEAAPAACEHAPQLALLSDGPTNTAWFEHRLLAEAMGIPIATPDTLWPTVGGGIAVDVRGERVPVDVFYRRFDDDELAAHLTPSGVPVATMLAEAVRAGRVSVANVPGNGVADDKATYCYVPEMIRFYLGEEPLLATVPTWVLADDDDLAEVRDRLHELVVKPVDGYGGQGVVFGATCSAAQLAELRATVLAAPHRFVAQEPVDFSTAPTLVRGALAPRHVDLRVFAVAGLTTRVVPAALTRVALAEGGLVVNSSRGGGSKDTWLLRP